MKIVAASGSGLQKAVKGLGLGGGAVPPATMTKARAIFDDVEKRGDAALFEWTARLEDHKLDPKTVRVSDAEMKEAWDLVPARDRRAIALAAKRIQAFHRRQRPQGFVFNDGHGTVIEERVVPLERVGVCIPGGRFPLASTALMTAIPARLAGVKEIVMISPWPGGRMSPHVLTAARVAGVGAVYKIGGAQGVAALAVGTKTVPRVDKIVGPGSAWVTAAKSIAASRGLVGIESLAGPSEVVVLADDSADAGLVAVDLLSQAEHGPDSFAILVTDSRRLAADAQAELGRLFAELGYGREAVRSAAARVSAIVTPDLADAIRAVNLIGPEHLEVMTRTPRKIAAKFQNAASVFIGPNSPVPAGDYMAGANHVLPTGGTARFSSPLGVQDFMKRQSVTTLSRRALAAIAEPVARFAEFEGLPAHARSVRARVKP